MKTITDTTPTGRIMNRFSRDIDTIDLAIAMNLRITVMQFFRTIVALGMISLQSVILLVGVVPIVIIYYLVQKIYISTSRQLRRIDSTSRSPIYNHFSETIQGITSIRAYGAKEQFIKESNQRIDTNHKCYYLTLIAARWLGVRLEFLGYCIVFLTAMFSVIYRDTLSPGIAGISISYALNITAVLGVLVRFLTDLETNFVSVERIIEYTSVQPEVCLFRSKS